MDEHSYEMFVEEKRNKNNNQHVWHGCLLPPCLLAHFVSSFPHTGWLLWLSFLLLLPLVDCCGYFSFPLAQCHFFLSYFFFNHANAMMPLSGLQLLGVSFSFSLDTTLWKFLFKFHANLTMPLSGYWKLWLPVGTKIECAALCCTQCKHCSRKNNNPLIPSFQKLGIMAASQISSCMQCKHHHRKRQQSNCTAGGNPKFLEIGNHGCQLDF